MNATLVTHASDEASGTQDHRSNVAHHFESAQQQFDAGKLGMWLFLVTEVLFFSGLFVAYAVYRSYHPEVFVDAHKYLNTTLGALNTIVLLFSSLTMAWAVRCAQLGQQRGLVLLLAVTLACASLFLGVKAVEYSHKWGEGLLWARAYVAETPTGPEVAHQIRKALIVISAPAMCALLVSVAGWLVSRRRRDQGGRRISLWRYLAIASAAYFVGLAVGEKVQGLSGSHASHDTHASVDAHEPDALSSEEGGATEERSSDHGVSQMGVSDLGVSDRQDPAAAKLETGVFFSIYYAMTGVHAIHILAGMGVIIWLLRRSINGDFGPDYFGPVDFVGLYWHLVDLVWIYLFPLLYLIR